MTNNTRTNTRPHIKWGSLILAALSLVLELALIGLNLYANTGAMADADLALGFFAAYGWIFGLVILMGGIATFFEEFVPSYHAHQKWEKQRAIQKAKYQAEVEIYEDFLSQRG